MLLGVVKKLPGASVSCGEVSARFCGVGAGTVGLWCPCGAGSCLWKELLSL